MFLFKIKSSAGTTICTKDACLLRGWTQHMYLKQTNPDMPTVIWQVESAHDCTQFCARRALPLEQLEFSKHMLKREGAEVKPTVHISCLACTGSLHRPHNTPRSKLFLVTSAILTGCRDSRPNVTQVETSLTMLAGCVDRLQLTEARVPPPLHKLTAASAAKMPLACISQLFPRAGNDEGNGAKPLNGESRMS